MNNLSIVGRLATDVRLDTPKGKPIATIYTHVRAPLQSDAAERVASMIPPTSFGLPGG